MSNHGMNIKTRVIQSNSLSFDIKNDNTSSVPIKQSCLFKTTRSKQAYPYKIIQFGHASFSSHKMPPSCTTQMTSRAIGSYFLTRFSFFNPHAIHERKPYNITGGMEYDDRVNIEKTKSKKSHIDAANQRAMEMPINRYQCEE